MAEPTVENQALPDNDVSPDAEPLLKKMGERVDASERKWNKQFKKIKRNRKYMEGLVDGDGGYDEAKAMANLVFATTQGLLPHYFAKNPEVQVQPAQHVNPRADSYELTGRFARTIELTLNRVMDESKLKERAKAMIRSILSSGVGWIKVSYQRDIYEDPIIKGRLEDMNKTVGELQMRLQRVQEGEEDPDELKIQEEEAVQIVGSLQKQLEVIRAEGLVIDNIPVECMRMDPGVRTIEEYQLAGWIAFYTYMTPEKVMATYNLSKEEVEKHTFYGYQVIDEHDPRPSIAGDDERSRKQKGDFYGSLLRVWELYDKDVNTVYTWADGGEQWLKPPQHPDPIGERFYPFFMLGFNWIDGVDWPLSDVDLLRNLQDEYQNTRLQQAKHRELAKPMWAGDRDRVTRQDIEAFSMGDIGEVVLVSAGGQPVNQVFTPAVHPPFNPQIYDTNQIRSDMEWVSGLGDAMRGSVQRAKTATEANIVREGLGDRVGEKQDTTESFLTELSRYIIQVLMQELPPELVQRFAGPEAIWPQTDEKWSLYNQIEIEVKGGSTGKPDKMKEMELWSGIYPEIRETMGMALQMQMEQGVPVDVNPWIELLRETFQIAEMSKDPAEYFNEMFSWMNEQMMQEQQQMAQLQQAAQMGDPQAIAQLQQMEQQQPSPEEQAAIEEQKAQADHQRNIELEQVKGAQRGPIQ